MTTTSIADLRDDADRAARSAAVEEEVAGRGLETVRLSFADQHGLLRGKVLDAARIGEALGHGVALPGSLLTKDTGHYYAFNIWEPMGGPTLSSLLGARDMLMVPDPSTFRVLPWRNGTGWMLCDLFTVEGAPIELSTRRLCATAHDGLAQRSLYLRAGLEVEFHLYQSDADPGDHRPIHPG